VEHLQHFGLSEDPFRNEPRPRDYFETPSSRDALARMDRALRQHKGLLVLTGEGGCGKTMVARQLLDHLEEEVFEAAMLVVLNGAADAGWMLTRFAKLLGIEEPAREREALVAQVYEQLAIVREDGRHTVLLIDDADALAAGATLGEVCGLLKLEYEERRLFSLVLCGGPALERAVTSDPQIAHRVEVKVVMRALDAAASGTYLSRRIRNAGGDSGILDTSALAALHKLGGGLPGRMNTLADNALFEAFLCGRPRIEAGDVERAWGGLGWTQEGPAAAPVPAGAPPVSRTRPEAPLPPPPVRQAEAEPTILLREGDALFQPSQDDGDDLEEDLEAVFMSATSSRPKPARKRIPARREDDPDDLVIELLDE
jgi:type II secretory pathway predicted ATPase ExeA